VQSRARSAATTAALSHDDGYPSARVAERVRDAQAAAAAARANATRRHAADARMHLSFV
jgi:hypothetical protein